MSEFSYLTTKVTVPPVRATHVSRLPLSAHLDSPVPLVLLAAGGGFGKTTLLATWAREVRHQVAWLTLDEQDNDPVRFWILVFLALRQSDIGTRPVPGETAITLLNAPSPPPLLTVLTMFLNDLATLEGDLALVLDDYQVINEPSIHQSLDFVLAHAPANLHLLLATRVDPPLALSRLRARAQLVEIRDADLRLDVHESAAFLTHTMGLTLRETEIHHLWQRTEGWLVGLQLAALSLRTHTHVEPAIFLNQFSGSQSFLFDYIQDEILAHVPLATRHFLLRTSILTTLCADLCQQVTEEPASQLLLESLERANLFLVPLDTERRWYRYHPLFREALQAYLQRSGLEPVSRLHQRASVWYAQQSRYAEAIPHALAAHDFATAATLIERFLVPQSWRNEYHTLRRWLGNLPHAVLRTYPDLSFLLARALLLSSQAEASIWRSMEVPLQLAEQGYRDVGNQAGIGCVLTTRAVITSFQGDLLQAFTLARLALTLLPSEDRQWRGECLSILGTEAFLLGQQMQAMSLLQQALACHDASGYLTGRQFTTLMLGEVSMVAGDFQAATSFFHQTLGAATEQAELLRDQGIDERGKRRAHFEGLAWYGLAFLAYLRHDLAEAQHALQEGVGEGWFVLLPILTPGLLLQVRLLYAQDEIEQAQTLLSRLAQREARLEVQREIRLCQAWLALKVGDLANVQRWAEELTGARIPLVLARREEEVLLLVRLRLQEGQPEVALDVLAPLLLEAQAQARLHSELQILLLSALAEAARGAQEQACRELLQAVIKTRHMDAFSLFLEEGAPMKTLLTLLVADVQGMEFVSSSVQRVLQCFG